MRVKVPTAFIDGEALECVIHMTVMQQVDRLLPKRKDIPEREDDRDALYETLFERMQALHHLFTQRTYMVVDLEEDKAARIVRIL